MWLQQLIRTLKSPWLYVGVLVALAALVSGLLHGMSNPAEIAAQESTPNVNPRIVTLVATPDTSRAVTIERDKKYGKFSVRTRQPVAKDSLSKAYQEYRDAPPGRALYFRETDKVIHLPDDVRIQRVIAFGTCVDLANCPDLPAYVLEKGEATISIDSNGNVIPNMFPSDDPDSFQFLAE